jgi:molybdopterin-guanine dinucleotide biosynthesis protein A
MSQVIGVVLAGGRGQRFGKPKGEVMFEGATLAQRASERLWPLCTGVLVSIRKGAQNPAPDLIPLEDPPPAGRGPLVGIQCAMEVTAAADLLVLACDYPRIDTDLLGLLVKHSSDGEDLVMLTDGTGRDHPLAALWRRSSQPAIQEALDQKQYKVRAVLGALNVTRLGPEQIPDRDLTRALTNVNRAEQLERL